MRMRAVAGGIDLPPRQPVELKPGGYHLMLTDLKKALVAGETVPLILEFVDRAGRKSPRAAGRAGARRRRQVRRRGRGPSPLRPGSPARRDEEARTR